MLVKCLVKVRRAVWDAWLLMFALLGVACADEPDPMALLRESREACRKLVDSTELGTRRREAEVSYLGAERLAGGMAHVIVRCFTRRREDYPVYMGVCHIDQRSLLPVKVLGYDWDHTLVSCYTYADIKANAGLTDSDFDIRNPAYDLPRGLNIFK